MMIPTPTTAPMVAQSEAPVEAHVAVPTNASVSMEVAHTVPPPPPQLDIDSAAAMLANEEKMSELEIRAEVDGYFVEST